MPPFHHTECVFSIGVATPFTEDCATPDSSLDSHPQLETTLRMIVRTTRRVVEIGLQEDKGSETQFARAQRATDGRLIMTICGALPPNLSDADVKRIVASIASVVGLTTGREEWHFDEGASSTIPFAVHRKAGIRVIDESTRECVAHMTLRGRRLTNRNKKQPATPDEPYMFEAKTPKSGGRQGEWARRDGGAVDDVAHPFVAILRELYKQVASGSVTLQDCAVPWKGGVGGLPNGNLECYDGKDPRRIRLPILCFAVDEGANLS